MVSELNVPQLMCPINTNESYMFEQYRGFAVCEPHAKLPKSATQPTAHSALRALSQVGPTRLTDPARHTAGSHVKSARVKSPPSEGGGSLRFKKARIRLGSR